MNKIKECPFCGYIPYWNGYSGGVTIDSHIICCGKCGSCSDTYSTEKKAIKAWNTRTVKDEQN